MAESFSHHDEPVVLTDAELSPVEQFRRQHRTAVLVVMFTDMAGSTQRAEQRGEVHAQWIRQQHDQIVEELVTAGDAGRVVKTIGDSALCVFAEPTAAVERALAVQLRFDKLRDEYPDALPLEVRIGLHMGQVAVADSVQRDVFGRHVNRAKRIEELAHGRQVLASFPVYDSARGWLAAQGAAWQDHGEFVLKGIAEPVRVFEVFRAGMVPRRPRGRRPRFRLRVAAFAVLVAALAAIAVVVRVAMPPPQEIIVRPAREIPNPDLVPAGQ